MTTEDDVFLTAYNQKKPAAAKCSEDDFEKIMEIFEETAELQTPYASVDSTVVSFETMKTAIKQELKTEELPGFAKDIYDFWKSRRQDSGNNPLQPTLKFETHQDNDDGDPYVCFRRREVRQTRKTRARDVQSTDRLRKLRTELEEGRKLVALAQHRETMKRNLLNVEKSIYDQRAKVKDAKVRLGIRTDDEDLINQKVYSTQFETVIQADMKQPQKRKISDHPQIRIPPGGQLRLPGRSDGRPLDADLISLNEVNEQKENSLNRDIENRMQQHQKRNEGQIDLTREPLSPVQGQRPSFRPVETEYHLLTPPSSVNSESFDPLSPAPEKSEGFAFRYSSPPEEDKPQGRPAYRRRIGRCNRLWIDRRGMPSTPRNDDAVVSDRWKYDQDDDDEQPVYEVDPYDIGALKFRATIPLPPHFLPQRTRQEGAAALAARVNGNNPSNVRAIAAAPQSSAPT